MKPEDLYTEQVRSTAGALEIWVRFGAFLFIAYAVSLHTSWTNAVAITLAFALLTKALAHRA